jgi:hypothetical protein
MANPRPPAATYPAMGGRAGYSDGNALTTAELNAAAALLVAQDCNGNVQQIVSMRGGRMRSSWPIRPGTPGTRSTYHPGTAGTGAQDIIIAQRRASHPFIFLTAAVP